MPDRNQLQPASPWVQIQTTPEDWAKASPQLLETMLCQLHLIRAFEEQVLELAGAGLVHGPAHSSIGQEGGAVGSIISLGTKDSINGSHRGHHQFLAKVLNHVSNGNLDATNLITPAIQEVLQKTLAEILGLAQGYCSGRGGSMHLQYFEAGALGTNAIVGGGVPLAAGNAWAQRKAITDNVTVTYFGDGAVNIGSVGAPMTGIQGHDDDWRVRLVLPKELASSMYQKLTEPLGKDFRGVVFPYTPNITVSYTADWQAQKLTHSNYAAQFYNSSEIQDIQIQGTFTAQNQEEARYVLAVLTFGKLVTKMFFGKSDPHTGNPPPIVHLYGHGTYQWNRVPVVIKNFQYSLPPEVDYIAVMDGNKAVARVPTIIDNIAFTVAPVYSRAEMAKYDYKEFVSGNLIQGGFI